MQGRELSAATTSRLRSLFRECDHSEARRILVEECGNNLPFLQDADEIALERFRFAAMKLSDGDLPKLREAVELAKLDWRDLLVATGFANDPEAHASWWPTQRVPF